MSHSTSRRIALFTRRFTLTPSWSPNFRKNSSTSRSMRIVRVTLLLADNGSSPQPPKRRRTRVCYFDRAILSLSREETEPDDDLVLRFLHFHVFLQKFPKRRLDRLLVERRPSRSAPVLLADNGPVLLDELLIGECST